MNSNAQTVKISVRHTAVDGVKPSPLPAPILKWSQVDRDLLEEFDLALKDNKWGTAAVTRNCAIIPQGVLNHDLELSDHQSPTSKFHNADLLVRTYSIHQRELLNNSDDLYSSDYTPGPLTDENNECIQSSLLPLIPQTSNRSAKLIVAPSAHQKNTPLRKAASPIIVRQMQPSIMSADDTSFNKYSRSKEQSKVRSVNIELDGLGGAIVAFTPLDPPSLSHATRKSYHTVSLSPRKEFPKMATSFQKRMQQSAPIEGAKSEPAACVNLGNSTPPINIIVSTPQRKNKSAAPPFSAKTRPSYKLTPCVETKVYSNDNLSEILTPSPAIDTTTRFSTVEGTLIPVTEPLSSTSVVNSSQKSNTPKLWRSACKENRPPKSSASDKQKSAIYTAKITPARDVPVSYDAFVETPLQTHDRNIMHTLNLSAIELCALGLHDGRTMTSRARAISALREKTC